MIFPPTPCLDFVTTTDSFPICICEMGLLIFKLSQCNGTVGIGTLAKGQAIVYLVFKCTDCTLEVEDMSYKIFV